LAQVRTRRNEVAVIRVELQATGVLSSDERERLSRSLAGALLAGLGSPALAENEMVIVIADASGPRAPAASSRSRFTPADRPRA
jgi:hypothetical protein